ncbi:DNA cytosine methyltransferase [Aeromicrobium sp.]|uniref:DNA cytosine methyltransferase n=1 Tax=Aeromicrobium sp. TaxID=1871063 RepID=UPI0025BF218C|nr:DNA (cytosine-5-)-methyltransferase [Aeromicrobium sp.]
MTIAPDHPIATAEFFAGIGLMAAALEPRGFDVQWANDIERAKYDLYLANRPHAVDAFKLGDVRGVLGDQLPNIELATASFPCVDLSLAGNRKGLTGEQSGMFWEFARVLEQMNELRPRAVLLENVHGFATSRGGKDLRIAMERLAELGYSCDVIAINARHFVPQSRPRMFVVGLRGDLPAGAQLGVPPISDVRPGWVQQIHALNQDLPMHYIDLPGLPDGPEDLRRVVQRLDADDARWWDEERTAKFVTSLAPLHAARLESLAAGEKTAWRTAYRRTRHGVATWEIRADPIAGCLRTTGGGSSKQALVQAGRGQMRVRWMTPLEYARLMGAGRFKTRARTDNQALFGFGDAVVVDVIAWIADNYLLPTLRPAALI